MKKQTFNIICRAGVFQVNGELFSSNGVDLFIHKNPGSSSWCISELSTGFRVLCTGDYNKATGACIPKGKAAIISAAKAILNTADIRHKISEARDYNLKHGGKVVNEKG